MSSSAFTPSNNLSLPATDTQAGTVSTTAQTFAGEKTFQDGAAIKGATAERSTGYVGEIIRASIIANTTTSVADTELDVAGSTLSNLTAGVWQLFWHLTTRTSNQTGSATSNIFGRTRVTTSGNSVVSGTSSFFGSDYYASSQDLYFTVSGSAVITVASTTSYKLRVTGSVASATGFCQVIGADAGTFTGGSNTCTFYAVRIA